MSIFPEIPDSNCPPDEVTLEGDVNITPTISYQVCDASGNPINVVHLLDENGAPTGAPGYYDLQMNAVVPTFPLGLCNQDGFVVQCLCDVAEITLDLNWDANDLIGAWTIGLSNNHSYSAADPFASGSIDWGDGTVQSFPQGATINHTYSSTVEVSYPVEAVVTTANGNEFVVNFVVSFDENGNVTAYDGMQGAAISLVAPNETVSYAVSYGHYFQRIDADGTVINTELDGTTPYALQGTPACECPSQVKQDRFERVVLEIVCADNPIADCDQGGGQQP